MATLSEVVLIAGLAGAATGLGALPVLVTDQVSHRVYDAALGLAAGIMFGAAVFALVLPALELGSLFEVSVGVLAGGAFLLGANGLLPHIHMQFAGEHREGVPAIEEEGLQRALLVGGAITLHNVPEGLAVGIAFASGEEAVGLALAVAIAVQNVPDGFAMAVPAVDAGVSKARTVLYTTLSGGLPEPAAAAVGFALVVFVTDLFPAAAGFAAGAMIAVIFREMIPASHGHGYEDFATLTFVCGFVTMMIIDIALAV
ncbi:MAG: ZIP family metal transporter [Haloarculaceae archaeon]